MAKAGLEFTVSCEPMGEPTRVRWEKRLARFANTSSSPNNLQKFASVIHIRQLVLYSQL